MFLQSTVPKPFSRIKYLIVIGETADTCQRLTTAPFSILVAFLFLHCSKNPNWICWACRNDWWLVIAVVIEYYSITINLSCLTYVDYCWNGRRHAGASIEYAVPTDASGRLEVRVVAVCLVDALSNKFGVSTYIDWIPMLEYHFSR